MVSLGTGKAPARTFEEKNLEAKMRPEVIEEVIKRTFGNSKAKTNGTGIWLRSVSKCTLVQFGTPTQLDDFRWGARVGMF